MSARSKAAVSEAIEASRRLRLGAQGRAVPLAVADYLDSLARYWRDWFPADPSAMDIAAVAIIRAVIATYPEPEPEPDTVKSAPSARG